MNYQRREQIRQLLAEKQRISIREVSDKFNVSVATARRDLDALASEGMLQRVHGGARLVTHPPPEQPIHRRSLDQAAEKECIGRVAAELIGDNETVFLGSGTTVLEVAKRLIDRSNLTVITNSLPVVNTLAEQPDISLIIVGGIFRQSEYSTYGHLTELALDEINANKVFIGIRAISLENGLTYDFMPDVSTDRKILGIARDITLVADHTKFNRVAAGVVCPLSAIHRIITDEGTPGELLAELSKTGVQVVVAR